MNITSCWRKLARGHDFIPPGQVWNVTDGSSPTSRHGCLLLSSLFDMKHGRWDLPVAARADPGQLMPAVRQRGFGAVGISPQGWRIGAEAFLRLRGERMEGLNAGVLVLGEAAEIYRGPARGLP